MPVFASIVQFPNILTSVNLVSIFGYRLSRLSLSVEATAAMRNRDRLLKIASLICCRLKDHPAQTSSGYPFLSVTDLAK